MGERGRMKCVYCGQVYDEMSNFHNCSYPFHSKPTSESQSLDSIADVLRDILEELKKANELREGK